MGNLFDFKNVKNKPSRSGFDLGYKLLTTAKSGELRPLHAELINPGDTYRFGEQHLTRTLPVQSSAFVRIKEYFDWFFVPMRLMWRNWGTFYSQVGQLSQVQAASVKASVQVPSDAPYVKLRNLVNSTGYVYRGLSNVDNPTNQFGFNRVNLWAKLCSDLGYFRYTDKMVETQATKSSNFVVFDMPVHLWFLAAYHKVYDDYYRFEQWEKPKPFLWNFDYITAVSASGSLVSLPEPTDSYWDRFTMFDMHYSNWNKDVFMGLMPNQQYGEAAAIELSASTSPQELVGSPVSPLDLKFTSPLVNGLVGLPNSSSQPGANPVVPIMGQPIVGQDGQIGLSYQTGINIQPTPGDLRAFGSVSVDQDVALPNYRVPLNSFDSVAQFTVIALRQAEALQRWKEVTQSGDQTYRDQVYRHFGVSLPQELGDISIFLGGDDNQIDIGEVINNNLTGDNPADIKGRGVGVGKRQFERTFKEHGVLICVYHNQPMLDYDITGVGLQLPLVDVADYFIPEFDRIGLEELPGYYIGNASADYETNGSTSSNDPFTIGYVPRYYQYKTAYDRVTGEFRNSLYNWVAPIDNDYLTDGASGYPDITYQFFKCDPRVLNSIFVSEMDSKTSSDPFLLNIYFNIKAVRNMDYNGLPY